MKKRINCLLRRCKTLSRQLGRSSSYSSLRSRSYRDHVEETVTVLVGSSRRRYVISSEYLNHPVLTPLIDADPNDPVFIVKCEVVLFDHLLWMLQNADPEFASDSFEDLAQLYVY